MNKQEYERFKAGEPVIHVVTGKVIHFVKEWVDIDLETQAKIPMIKVKRGGIGPYPNMRLNLFLDKWSLSYSLPRETSIPLDTEALLNIALGHIENEGGVNHEIQRAKPRRYPALPLMTKPMVEGPPLTQRAKPKGIYNLLRHISDEPKRPKPLRDCITNFSFAEHEAEQKKCPVLHCAIIGRLMK